MFKFLSPFPSLLRGERKLREEGLLTLEPGKGRDLKIRLTPAGRRLGEERLLPLMELENDAFRDMGPKDSRLLTKKPSTTP